MKKTLLISLSILLVCCTTETSTNDVPNIDTQVNHEPTVEPLKYSDAGTLHNDILRALDENFKEAEVESKEEAMKHIHTQTTNVAPSVNTYFGKQDYQYNHLFDFEQVQDKEYISEIVDKVTSEGKISEVGIGILQEFSKQFLLNSEAKFDEVKQLIRSLLEKLESIEFDNPNEKESLGVILYVTDGSLDFWSERNGGNPVSAIGPAAADAVGVVVSVALDALDEDGLNADKIDDHIIAGVVSSAGSTTKVMGWIKKIFG